MTEQPNQNSTDASDPHGSLSTYEARWIEQTVETRALLSHGITKPIVDMLEEVDENLNDFKDGGYPPGSDELYGIYYDAVTRAAIPYGQPPMSVDEVAEELRAAGIDVPTVDLATIGARTGITPLHPNEVTAKLDAARPNSQPAASAEVTIYGLPNCVGCAATERALKKADVAYDKIDLTERPDLVEMFKAQGLAQAPIVEAKGDRWSGYRPDKLRQHGLDHRDRQRRDGTHGQNEGHGR